ncbi:alpha/beta fold hydrolase [Micropruina sp.]|uniref:alpha/beta fold hydrolase n=1 Tax=Micropruina sp. TaxID=2737536 RepID=UPI0039E6478A
MRISLRWAVGFVALLLLSACTPGQVPSPSAPGSSTPSAAPAPTGAVIEVSLVQGLEVDRPRRSDSNAKPKGFETAPPGEGLAGYREQKLGWSTCGQVYKCAEILVPLDYANPGDQAITLALAKKPATKSPKLGTLFVNPGGPGASGRNLVTYFASAGLEQYDIVGWDPRGTNASTPVQCFDDEQTQAFTELDSSPDDAAETAALIVGTWQFAQSCWQHSGELLQHISTVDTVRDLDLLRELVGDQKLNYLGYSYGTQVGAYYADLFPQRVGRLVLDAAVDITDDDTVIQAMGFDLALGNFAAWCARQNCSLGSSKDAVLQTITDLFDTLDATPLQVGDRPLTQTLAATGVASYLYGGIPAWKVLAADLKAALAGDGAALLKASDQLNDRNDDGTFGSMFYSFPAIGCADGYDKGVVEAEQRWTTDQQKAPIFGKYFGPGYTCPLWPVRSTIQFKPTGSGAAPIVVVGATGDPATPYQQAVTMAEQLESGVLVTYEGEGHGTFGGKSECVDRLVIAYLTKGTVPSDGVKCQ